MQALYSTNTHRGIYLVYLAFFWCFGLLPTPADAHSTQEYELTVLDGESGEPLIGATVVNLTRHPDRSEGQTTDIDGKVPLDAPGHRDMIEISYIGYTTIRPFFYEIRERKGVVRLLPAVEMLGEVVVIGRKDQAETEIPYVVERIDRRDIEFYNGQTSADILETNAGLYVQRSQMGGGSPIIRGFEANRVLLVLDGVRMNNAIYRGGHLQNSITVDNSILERAEVIYGPGSLMYGSDAIGGVVHYRTRDPKLLFGESQKGYRFDTNASTRFSTANQEKTVHLDLDYGTRSWGSLTSLTYADYGDLTAGANRPEAYPDFGKRKFFVYRNENVDEIRSRDEDIQTGTAYSQIDLLQKVKYQPSDRFYMVLNLQYSTSSDVPRYDNLVDTLDSANRLKWAEWYYGPQQRMFGSLKFRMLNSSGIYNKASIILAAQRIDEDRLKRRFRSSHRTFNLEDVQVYSFTADFDKYLGKSQRNTLSYGFDVSYNDVASSAGRMNVKSGNVIYDVLTRYPSGGSTMRTAAGYLNYYWKSRDTSFHFNLGGRYTDTEVRLQYDRTTDESLIEWPELYYNGLVTRNNAMTWAAGINWNSRDNWQLRAITSTAFRSPNLDDLAKIRPKNSKISVPNLDLKPEFSLNYELSLGKQIGQVTNFSGSHFKLSATAFYTELTDAVVRENGELPNGDITMVVEGDVHDVQQNTNAGEAFVYGLSANAEFNMANRFFIQSSYTITKGRRTYRELEEGVLIDTLVPLDHIPPHYGRTSIAYRGDKFRIEGVLRYNGAKSVEEYAVGSIDLHSECGHVIDREGMSDNIEYGLINNNPGECESIYAGLPAWMTYNLYLSYRFSERFSIDLAAENLTDVHYRQFGSGLSAPGRNFILTLRGSF